MDKRGALIAVALPPRRAERAEHCRGHEGLLTTTQPVYPDLKLQPEPWKRTVAGKSGFSSFSAMDIDVAWTASSA